jgi:hypothetical protein
MTISRLRRRDHFLHQPAQSADVAGWIDTVAETNNDETL